MNEDESSSAGAARFAQTAHGRVFATTHWSVVFNALHQPSAASAEALQTLCQLYWYPLYAYVRRMGRSPADAEDLTQGFFQKLLEKSYLSAANPTKGRFRTFLLTALKGFIANEWDREHAAKRGGFAPRISIDQEMAEDRFSREPSHRLQPDVLFDRCWAIALLDQTMRQLREEYVASGRSMLFEHLQNCLTKDECALPYQMIAERINSTEAGVKMAMQRLRHRYREILREHVAQTVASTEELDEEMRHLFAAFD